MKTRRCFYAFLFFFLSSFFFFLQAQNLKNPFRVEWDDSIQQLLPGEEYKLSVHFEIPPEHYLYADKTTVELKSTGGLEKIKEIIPSSQKKQDPFSHQEEEVFLESFDIQYLFRVPSPMDLGRQTLEAEVRYQGCAPNFCFRPMKSTLLIPLEIVREKKQALNPLPHKPEEIKNSSLNKTSFFQRVKEARVEDLTHLSPILLIFFVFLGGLLTDFTPCVLPIVPLTLAIIGAKKGRHILHNFGLSLTLVLGLSLTYALLGLASAGLGLSIGFLFQNRIFLVFTILFFVAMSLSLLGLFPIQMPYRLRHFFGHIGGQGYRGSFLAGLSLGFIASPCVGPLMAPILLLVAKSQNLAWGALLLFVYGLGMGMIFLVGGTFYSTLGSRIRGGKFTEVLKKFLALTLLIPAFYYAYILFQPGSKNRDSLWLPSLSQGFSQSQKNNQPVLIDFYSDFCLPCLEIDHQTFKDPQVREKLKEIVAVKIDCTQDTPECSEAVKRYDVVGWPTLLFLNSKGEVQNDLTIVGEFVPPQKMLELLDTLKKR